MCERPEFDARDAILLAARVTARSALDGPLVGDFVQMPGEDHIRRFTHDWGDNIQTTWRGDGGDGFYLCRNGRMSYSGGLDPAIPKAQLQDTGELRMGRAWFFHHDYSGAHRGVAVNVPCKVYRYLP